MAGACGDGSSPLSDRTVRYLFARTLESMGRLKEAVEYYRTISRNGRNYRDVAVRIDKLGLSTTVDADVEALAASPTWLRSLVRNCSQLLRSTG